MHNVHTKTELIKYLILFFTAGGFAGKFGSMDEIVGKETDTVTLKCSFELSSEYNYLYWYKQYSNGAPQFLLYEDGIPTDFRLDAELTSHSCQLSIRGLKLSDSALYHCALRVVAQ